MHSRAWRLRSLILAVLALFPVMLAAQAAPASGQQPATAMPAVVTVPPEAQPSPTFNAEVATRAYLAEIPPAAKARSDAYFEGGYWLILVDFLYGAAVALLLLTRRWSAGMRNLAERITRFKPLQTALYWAQYLVAVSILGFPLTVYEGYYREHKYGLATQSFGPWMGDHLKGLLLGLVLGGLLVMVLFGVVRRFPRRWPVLGAVVMILFFVFINLIGPVYLLPIFYHPKRLEDPRITQPILSLARANGIPARDVWEIDESTKSTRMSANVSGLGSTMRITLNDNLLHRGSPEEIQAVMGHEMGHYVLNHVYSLVVFFGLVFIGFFAYLYWALQWALKRWGEKWQIRGVSDTAVLPLVALLGALYFFVLTPITNTFIRTQEHEADMYGLNASRQPDGFAQAAIHLGEYRKMEPGTLEEWIFFDHPSGRRRIYDGMRWKAENLKLMEAQPGQASAPVSSEKATVK